MQKVSISIPKDVKCIMDALKSKGYESYIVGGCVRDSILKKQPKDWDITTNSLPEQTKSIFINSGFRVIETGLKHGTITILVNGTGYEVTTYRIEGEYSDNRHPDYVNFTKSIKKDLERRDFTINSMAYNEDDGLIDYFNGIKDLEKKAIRCVGEADDRFNEDALRMLRAVRFSAQLGFDLDSELLISVRKNAHLIKNISQERIREELCKILISNKPSLGIVALKGSTLLQYILPELTPCIDFQQHNIHHDKDVFNHTLAVVDNVPAKLEIRMAALLHDIGKPQCFTMGDNNQGHFYEHNKISANISRKILKRLKFDNKTTEIVTLLVYEHMNRFEKIKTSSIKKFINRVGIENLDDLFELQIADIKSLAKEFRNFNMVLDLKRKCQTIINEKQPLSIKDLAINGNDLISLGIQRGKQVGETLNMLMEMVLEQPELNNRENLIEIIRNRIP